MIAGDPRLRGLDPGSPRRAPPEEKGPAPHSEPSGRRDFSRPGRRRPGRLCRDAAAELGGEEPRRPRGGFRFDVGRWPTGTGIADRRTPDSRSVRLDPGRPPCGGPRATPFRRIPDDLLPPLTEPGSDHRLRRKFRNNQAWTHAGGQENYPPGIRAAARHRDPTRGGDGHIEPRRRLALHVTTRHITLWPVTPRRITSWPATPHRIAP